MNVGITVTLKNNRHNREHLIRDEHDVLKKEHINPLLTPLNRTYVDRNVEEVYHEVFDEAWKEWDGDYARRDKRKYKDYYEKIRVQDEKSTANKAAGKTYAAKQSNRNPHVVKSLWLQIGSVDERLSIEETYKWADKIYEHFEKDLGDHIKLVSCVLHLEEDALEDIDLSYLADENGNIDIKNITPEKLAQLQYAGVGHLHVDYIPVADNYKEGMRVRNSESRAYEQLGFNVTKEDKEKGYLIGDFPTAQKKFVNHLRVMMEDMAKEMGHTIKHNENSKKVVKLRTFQEKQDIKKITSLIHELDERGLSQDDFNKIQAMDRLSGQDAILEAFDNDIDKANEFLMMQNRIMEISRQHEFERTRKEQIEKHQARVKAVYHGDEEKQREEFSDTYDDQVK